MSEPDGKQSEAVKQARARGQRLANAFAEVFGQPRGRTAQQRLVFEHLEACAGGDGNDYRLNDARDGIKVIVAGIHIDGAKSVLRIIGRQLHIAATQGSGEKPKPVTIRRTPHHV